MKLGLRLFLGYFLIVGLTAWLSLKLVLDELKPVVRQVSEENLVELAQTLALVVQPSMQRGDLVGSDIARQLQTLAQTRLDATIWRQHKTRLALRIYITDANGIVLIDSSGEAVGKDFSRWNDVFLTLRGEYGVRSSRLTPDDEQSTVMHVAAPIRDGDKIIGVLTVALPNQSTQPYIDAARATLLRYGVVLLGFSLLIGVGFTSWLIWSLRQVSHYALAVSDNQKLQPPQFARGTELEKLTDALETMRSKLEGKDYVEQYVHTLTHELKSPLAAIQAATELLADAQMPADKRQQFLRSIHEQSERLHQLIQRLLELAKLEQRRALEHRETLPVSVLVEAAIGQLTALLSAKQLHWQLTGAPTLAISGERFLLEQALVNVLDNAIAFADIGSTVCIDAQQTASGLVIDVRNDGPPIPDYALPRLGERFYSLPRPDGRKGSGLGLRFAREVMTLHGGQLTVQNHATGVLVSLRFAAADTFGAD
ncbi:two-component system sensor histidine kinase CreC [Permianibacter sp. IMCC34836]|uniref:two-component system sensor histidine kinase CreC n=1 Tax=Permianibacter fluminis TaxID=2738515 RepID=UPI0015582BFC|nr:two-component system sensor histidine kinase CreC [Permianibacter fluminis]NQD36393.1 two-component system sensor histidine kinase CreC [Permianibacter fluminis]